MSTKEEWVRVESESELRPGMAVELRPCAMCSREERLILIRVGAPEHDGHRRGHRCVSVLPSHFYERTFLYTAIREGRLYRLSDLTDDSETTDATKELVTT